MNSPGQRLRALRESLGYTLRDVESASEQIARKYKNQEYALPIGRLSDIEKQGIVPGLFRLYSLAVIYRADYRDILGWYGIDFNAAPRDALMVDTTKTHLVETHKTMTTAQVPVKMDPSFDLKKTSNLGRLVQQWGPAPLAYLDQLAHEDYTYGFVGTDDYTMYPLILPGSFLQIDEDRDEVVAVSGTGSEYEIPVYFVQTRAGYLCCWCELQGENIFLKAKNPAIATRVMKHPQDADVIGQVVGVAMRLDYFSAPSRSLNTRAPLKLN